METRNRAHRRYSAGLDNKKMGGNRQPFRDKGIHLYDWSDYRPRCCCPKIWPQLFL
jgi:hypothetical protein